VKRLQAFLSLALLFVLSIQSRAVVFVDGSAGGANNGTSWTDAYVDLGNALTLSASGSEIWLAEGVYRPSGGANASFVLKTGMELLGGFTNGMATRTERSWAHNLTVLNGDISDDDTAAWGNRGDNSYTVVIAENTSGVLLDGLIIRGGNADQAGLATGQNAYGGGLFANTAPSLTVSNCVFSENSARGSGAINMRKCSAVHLSSSVFSGNRATEGPATGDFHSGAVGIAAFPGYSALVEGCTFSGNTTADRGGAIHTTDKQWDLHLLNCLFVGNSAPQEGDAVSLRNFDVPIENCTFVKHPSDALSAQACTAFVTNSIMWDNLIMFIGGTIAPAYCDLQDAAFAGSNGNTNLVPQFLVDTGGTWTAAATYDADFGLTTLTDTTAGWESGVLAGGTVNPDLGQALHFSIYSNTPSKLLVWGDATAGGSGDGYSLHDWHLKFTSPLIDLGDPASDYAREPDFSLGQINMGAYANTEEAATTNPPTVIEPESILLLVF